MKSQDDLFGGIPSLRGAKTAEEVLRRTGGDAIIAWLRSLGFWADETARRRVLDVPRTYSNPSDASGQALSEMLALWSSEYARATEILGVLQGERVRLKLEVDRVGAQVALSILRAKKEAQEKVPTQRVLDLEVASHPAYQECEDKLAVIDQAIKAMQGVKEATQGIRDGISREITRRGDAIRGRIE